MATAGTLTKVFGRTEMQQAIRAAEKLVICRCIYEHQRTGALIVTDDPEEIAAMQRNPDLYKVVWTWQKWGK